MSKNKTRTKLKKTRTVKNLLKLQEKLAQVIFFLTQLSISKLEFNKILYFSEKLYLRLFCSYDRKTDFLHPWSFKEENNLF